MHPARAASAARSAVTRMACEVGLAVFDIMEEERLAASGRSRSAAGCRNALPPCSTGSP